MVSSTTRLCRRHVVTRMCGHDVGVGPVGHEDGRQAAGVHLGGAGPVQRARRGSSPGAGHPPSKGAWNGLRQGPAFTSSRRPSPITQSTHRTMPELDQFVKITIDILQRPGTENPGSGRG